MCRLRNKGPGWDNNAGGERRYSCQVTNGWLARAGRDVGGSAGMGELARDFYISSSERERREWEAGRRLCGEWCQQSVARFPAGGEGQVLLSWTGHHSLYQPHSRISRHSAGEVERTDMGEQTVRDNYGRG